MNDILRFLGTCLVASFSGAFLGTAILAVQGGVKWADYGQAAFNWWVGDAVALWSVTPFLMESVLPPVRRFLGAKHAIAPGQENKGKHTGTSLLEVVGFVSKEAFILLLV
jgi:integral membrane sensor domain MASE1